MDNLTRYTLAFAISCLFNFGCGSSPQGPIPIGGPDSAPVISVQLNDKFNEVFPSEAIQLNDARFFTPPSIINVVQGAYSGTNFGQYLHARITVSGVACEYQGNSIYAVTLTLQSCYGGLGPNTYLPSGTVIELVNYDAPGLLLEVQFNLVR